MNELDPRLESLTVDEALALPENERRSLGLGKAYAAGWVHFGAQELKRTENPMWAVCALRYAMDWGLDVPQDVSRWATDGLMRYLSTDEPLEHCLSLNAGGRGQNTPRQSFRRETTRIVEMTGIFDLTRSLGFTVEQAAFAVAARRLLSERYGTEEVELSAEEYDAALDRVDALRDAWKSGKVARDIRQSGKAIRAAVAVTAAYPPSCWPSEKRGY